jgi:hypothetical protein
VLHSKLKGLSKMFEFEGAPLRRLSAVVGARWAGRCGEAGGHKALPYAHPNPINLIEARH